MATEPATPMKKKRQRVQQKRRIDAGSMRFTTRDADIIRIGAEQTFVRADSLGEYLDPDHMPATAEPSPEQLADTTPSVKRPWPGDLRHRLMAVSHLLRKLAARGYIEVIQPWSDQPAWYRATALGLRSLGLDWADIPFPADYDKLEARLRHDSQFRSHHHLITQVRLLLARGGAGAPRHAWKGEREIEAALPPRQKDVRRPHKADGIICLEEDGSWDVLSADKTQVLDTIQMKAAQIIGIEIEATQKSDHRLSEILPDLVARHDFVWYFCANRTIRATVVKARGEVLTTDDQRRRVRILLLEDYLP